MATIYCGGVIVFSECLTNVLIVETKWKENYGFPKGKTNIQDGWNWVNTALRETREETGLILDHNMLVKTPITSSVAFVEETIVDKKDNFECHCRYGIAIISSEKAKTASIESVQNMEEVFSVEWWPIERCERDLLHRRVVLLKRALSEIKKEHKV